VAKVDDVTIEPVVERSNPQAVRQPLIQRLPPLR
jgi:hypothetical protein